jgi:hypothetical protein
VIYQDPNTKNIGIGTLTPAAKLDVGGNVNATTMYQIGGNTILHTCCSDSDNTFVGISSGNFTGSGNANTAIGTFTLLYNTTGIGNTAAGLGSLQFNTTGQSNTAVGTEALTLNTSGNNNTAVGDNALSDSTTGHDNTALGIGAGASTTTGYANIFLGELGGSRNTTGSFNIYVGNEAPAGGTESNAIRIGDSANQTTAYIAGIFGSASSSGLPVYVNASGELGTQTSSLRFKEQVRDMGDSTNALMELRPVTFLYKRDYDKGERTLQYGLIAEEVAQVYPELVAYDRDGQPYSVKYQYLSVMLLNEAQRQYRHAEAQAEIITVQEQKIEALEQRLTRLERMVGNQVQTVAQK